MRNPYISPEESQRFWELGKAQEAAQTLEQSIVGGPGARAWSEIQAMQSAAMAIPAGQDLSIPGNYEIAYTGAPKSGGYAMTTLAMPKQMPAELGPAALEPAAAELNLQAPSGNGEIDWFTLLGALAIAF